MNAFEKFLAEAPAEVVDLGELIWWIPCRPGASGWEPELICLEDNQMRLEGHPVFTTLEGCLAGIEKHWPGCIACVYQSPADFLRRAESQGRLVFVDLEQGPEGISWEVFTTAPLGEPAEA